MKWAIVDTVTNGHRKTEVVTVSPEVNLLVRPRRSLLIDQIIGEHLERLKLRSWIGAGVLGRGGVGGRLLAERTNEPVALLGVAAGAPRRC